MNIHEENISSIGRSLLNRRDFMKNTGFSLGALGLSQLLHQDGLFASDNPTNFSGKAPIRPNIDPNNPYAPRDPHFEVAAKKVLIIFCPGAVSHVDTFDYKPDLIKYHGKNHSGCLQLPLRVHQEILPNPSGNLSPRVKVAKWYLIFYPTLVNWPMISALSTPYIPKRVLILRERIF